MRPQKLHRATAELCGLPFLSAPEVPNISSKHRVPTVHSKCKRGNIMGKRKGKSLMKLGLKRPPKKIWVNDGFGRGHYKYVRLRDRIDGSCFHVIEPKGREFEEETEIQPSLERMGLKRDEKGHIVPIKPRD